MAGWVATYYLSLFMIIPCLLEGRWDWMLFLLGIAWVVRAHIMLSVKLEQISKDLTTGATMEKTLKQAQRIARIPRIPRVGAK